MVKGMSCTQRVLAVVASLMIGSAAQAASVNLDQGAAGPGDDSAGGALSLSYGDLGLVNRATGVGAINDTWYFELPQASSIGAAVVSLVVDIPILPGTEYSISSLALTLFDASNTLLGSATTNSGLSLSNLAAGTYRMHIGGSADGSVGGIYNAAVAVAPVPLPAAGWLMLSGLVGLGAFARRRRAVEA